MIIKLTSQNSIALSLLRQMDESPSSHKLKNLDRQSDTPLYSQNVHTTASNSQKLTAEKLFSVLHQSPNEIKIKIMEKIGEKLGVDKTDFSNDGDYMRELKRAYKKLENRSDGAQIIASITEELGLDKLKISLSDATNSPRKLQEAIEASLGKTTNKEKENKAVAILPVNLDETDVYKTS